MILQFDIRKFSIKSIYALIIVFVISLVIIALGRVARWDLLEQIAMADNYLANGLLHAPPFGINPLHGHSVYFPGISFLAIGLKTIGVDYYLVEFMLLMAVTVLLFFMYVLTKFANSISTRKFPPHFYYPLLIAFFTLVAPNYVKYAIEFKPDTIALLMGYFGLSLIIEKSKSLGKYLLGIFFISTALVFKQQYLAFLFGLFLTIFIVGDKRFKFAVLLSTIFSACVFLLLINNNTIRFWTIDILSDDGIRTFREIMFDLIIIVPALFLFFFLFLFIRHKSEIILIRICKTNDLLRSIRLNPWYLVTLFVIVAAVLSALKVGGNTGNLELALAVSFPLFGGVFKNLVRWKLILIAWFGVVYFMGREIPSSLNNYNSAIALKKEVEKLEIKNNSRILTGSDVYYSSRFMVRTGVILENYWASSLIDDSSPYESLVSKIKDNDYDYMVIENSFANYKFISELKDYEILFENSLGILAKFKTLPQ